MPGAEHTLAMITCVDFLDIWFNLINYILDQESNHLQIISVAAARKIESDREVKKDGIGYLRLELTIVAGTIHQTEGQGRYGEEEVPAVPKQHFCSLLLLWVLYTVYFCKKNNNQTLGDCSGHGEENYDRNFIQYVS